MRVRVGVGYLSCTLTWSRPGAGDIVVTTPNSHTIFYNNTAPTPLTDQGRLDVDDKDATGPEKVFWSNSSSVPPHGTHYVCFEPFDFVPLIGSFHPIAVVVTIVRSANVLSTFRRNFTSTLSNGYACDAGSTTLMGSFT